MKLFLHLKKLINNFFKNILQSKIINKITNDNSFDLIFGHIYKEYDRKLIEKILKIFDCDKSEAQKYMKRCYYGRYKRKWEFAQKYADSHLISDDINKFINYKKLAKYLLNKGIFNFIKTNGYIHVFINE